MRNGKPNPLGLLVSDEEHNVPIRVQRYRMSGISAKKFGSDNIIFVLGINPQSQIMTFLFCRIAGKSGIVVNVIQSTADYSILSRNTGAFNLNSGLEITCVFPQKFRFIIFRIDGEAT